MKLVAGGFLSPSTSSELRNNLVDHLDHLDISCGRTQWGDDVETALSDRALYLGESILT